MIIFSTGKSFNPLLAPMQNKDDRSSCIHDVYGLISLVKLAEINRNHNSVNRTFPSCEVSIWFQIPQ